jgi:hypothetical protein
VLDHERHQARLGDGRQVDEHGAIRKGVANRTGELDGQPCLTRATHARERDQARRGQQSYQLAQLALPANQRRQGRWQTGGDRQRRIRVRRAMRGGGQEFGSRHARQVQRFRQSTDGVRLRMLSLAAFERADGFGGQVGALGELRLAQARRRAVAAQKVPKRRDHPG